MTKQEVARDRRLRRLYGIGLEDYNRMLAESKGLCMICGSPPVTNRLAVDHDHKARYTKVRTWYAGTWLAEADYRGKIRSVGETRNSAIRTVRQQIKRRSVRGLLCFHCNSGLRKYRDCPAYLENAATYLRKHQGAVKT